MDLFNRTKKCYKVVKLPKTLASETYGLKGCCERFLVLAGGSDDWQNDKTSAFIKLSLLSDNCTIVLKNDSGVNAIYQPNLTKFPNDELGYYATIDWKSVLLSDGVGCYKIEVNYSISGVTGTINWGEYELKQYSPDNAKGTVRLKAIFNQYNLIDEINMTGSNMVDTLRFNGYFGNRQPNTEIDNLIYQNRTIYNVQRENINSYTLESDQLTVNYTRKMLDLFFISESDLYISDHTPDNHTSEYKNTPVSVNESAELEYYKESKLAKVKINLFDKKRSQLTKFM
jgi:hypothetical protein